MQRLQGGEFVPPWDPELSLAISKAQFLRLLQFLGQRHLTYMRLDAFNMALT